MTEKKKNRNKKKIKKKKRGSLGGSKKIKEWIREEHLKGIVGCKKWVLPGKVIPEIWGGLEECFTGSKENWRNQCSDYKN